MFNLQLAMNLHARYTIVRKIADGGTAEIFLATQHGAQGFEKPVVLKRIFSAFYADPQFRNMLIDEALIAMSLNHSNIVQVLDLGESEGQYVMALELVDGWTLDALLRRTRAISTGVPPPLALYITAEVCRALAYAHAKTGADGQPLAIVHRDISPHNVLISEQGEVKLTDFGIAKAQNRREQSLGNLIKGKIAFMSPEQASGTHLDARSDLFSLGTMLYVMICRRYPFDAPTDLEVLLLVKGGEFVPPETARPGMNPEIYRVLRRAMARNPDQRYQRAEDMLLDVEQVMRVAFRAVGQTELKRWLLELSERDGVPALTRFIAPSPPAAPSNGEADGDTRRAADRADTVAVPVSAEATESASSRPSLMSEPTEAPGQGSGPVPSPLGATLSGLRKSSGGMAAARMDVSTTASAATGTGIVSAPAASGGSGPPPPPAAALATGRRAAPPPPPPESRVTRPHRPLELDARSGEAVTPLPTVALEQVITPPPVVVEAAIASAASEPEVPHAERRTSGAVPVAVASPLRNADSAPHAPLSAEITMPMRLARAPSRRLLVVLLGGAAVVTGAVVLLTRPLHTTAPRLSAPVVSHPAEGSPPSPPSASSSRPAAAISPVSGGPPAPASPATPVPTTSPPPSSPGPSPATSLPTAPAVAAAPAEPDHAPIPAESGGAEPAPVSVRAVRSASGSAQRIAVALDSVPSGAEVTSPHRTFGTTPVSVRLRPGVRYALTFRLDGYRPLIKRIQVNEDSEKELTVVLRRGSMRQPSSPDASPDSPPPPGKTGKRNWWQKMFTR